MVPQVISESVRDVTTPTALMLKAVLEIVIVVKTASNIASRLPRHRAPVLSGIGLWVVLAGSKFVVLELRALLFGDAVTLGDSSASPH